MTACRRMGSGSFHSPPGVLFTFPSRYLFTIGRDEYLALEGGPPNFPRNSTCSAVLTPLGSRRWPGVGYGALTPCGRPFQRRSPTGQASIPRRWSAATSHQQGLTPIPQRLQASARDRFRLLRVRSPLLAESRLISVPRGTEMFQFPRSPPRHLLRMTSRSWLGDGYLGMTPGGLPHSGIGGSTPADSSPPLIAAIHALHRLVAPRHPPCALGRAAPRPAPCSANRIDLAALLSLTRLHLSMFTDPSVAHPRGSLPRRFATPRRHPRLGSEAPDLGATAPPAIPPSPAPRHTTKNRPAPRPAPRAVLRGTRPL